ncbi:MAG: tRNA 2-thiouridine(34) synthase MnmA [Candidatus Liptonbacteria bacterium]|nr:tRNA 2-thiouridine(34) synthase MnmA [Candidatus Liptonbacteria bacterium]
MSKNDKKAARLPRGQRVFVGMSGGVDSSVAAYLLKKQGFNVTGVFLRCYNIDGCAERDAIDARRVAEKIGILFYVWDFEEEYKKKVVDYMIEGYKNGITPNPDVMCNREIKFGLFFKKALEVGADFVAMGHYVRLERNFKFPISNFKTIKNLEIKSKFKINNLKFRLLQAKDLNKDQTYFLWTLTQDDLKHCLFPIGDYLKSEVREIARAIGLPTAEKKDSQGICFLGKVSLDEFLSNYLPTKQGDVFNLSGEKIGSHFGAHFYTIGQRHANIVYEADKARPDMKPRYVVGKNVKTNAITVVEGDYAPELYKKEIELMDVNFINPQHSNILQNVGMLPVLARVRYRQPLVPANLKLINLKTYKLIFASPQKFIAPGQSAVFYEAGETCGEQGRTTCGEQGRTMLGGGVIE